MKHENHIFLVVKGRIWIFTGGNEVIQSVMSPRYRVREPGLQRLVGRVPSRGATFDLVYNKQLNSLRCLRCLLFKVRCSMFDVRY